MRYVPVSDPAVRGDLTSDLSGLVVGSAFLLFSVDQVERILKQVDAAAKAEYDKAVSAGEAPGVSTLTIDMGRMVGFDSLVELADQPEDTVIVQAYRYFDTPREAIVNAVIAAPHELKKTNLITFFCGPDRRKTGDYRVFSLHPGPKRQAFANRYQPEAQRRANQTYWDCHGFYATPNQIIASVRMMRERYTDLEEAARDRVFHLSRAVEAGLHRWYATWEQLTRGGDARDVLKNEFGRGDFYMAPNGTVYYYISESLQAPPDFESEATLESRLSNAKRPSIIRPDGSEEFYLNGKRHREGGAALFQPQPDGGWLEMWYEDGLLSRPPEDGAAKIVYDAKGEIVQEVAYYKGKEVESAVLGAASEAVKAMQLLVKDTTEKLTAFTDSPDFRLLRGQLELASNRQKVGVDAVVREMSKEGNQIGLRWDFDQMLEQDQRLAAQYKTLVEAVEKTGQSLVEAAQAMKFTSESDQNIVGAIWGKIQREVDRMVERGNIIPGEPGKTVTDPFIEARHESKKYFQSVAELQKSFSATGK